MITPTRRSPSPISTVGPLPLVPPATDAEGYSAKFNVNLRLAWAVNTMADNQVSRWTTPTTLACAGSPGANVDNVVGGNWENGDSFVETLNDSGGSFRNLYELALQTSGDMNSTAPSIL